VKTTSLIGVGISSLKVESTAIYAKGLGLVEWTDKRTLGNTRKSMISGYKIMSYDESSKG